LSSVFKGELLEASTEAVLYLMQSGSIKSNLKHFHLLRASLYPDILVQTTNNNYLLECKNLNPAGYETLKWVDNHIFNKVWRGKDYDLREVKTTIRGYQLHSYIHIESTPVPVLITTAHNWKPDAKDALDYFFKDNIITIPFQLKEYLLPKELIYGLIRVIK
jgi:hypothetical protein